jgi:hypothetical protein
VTLEEARVLVARIREEYAATSHDEVALAMLEDAVETWANIAAEVAATGLLTDGRWGKVANPLLGPLARARTSVLAALKSLGIKGD